jgi:hypothetical protein
MIREPTVGMRVIAGGTQHCGKSGMIVGVEDNGFWVQVKIDGVSGLWPKQYNQVTEIKESDMKKGDLVTITDDSWAIRVDKIVAAEGFHNDDYSGDFIVLEVIKQKCDKLKSSVGTIVHDIFIKGTNSHATYLHSSELVKLKQRVKEVTAEQMMRDLKEKYGCEVKVTE